MEMNWKGAREPRSLSAHVSRRMAKLPVASLSAPHSGRGTNRTSLVSSAVIDLSGRAGAVQLP